MLTGGAVVDRLGHRGDDIARQVRLDTSDQRRCNDSAGHDLVGRIRQLQKSGITDLCTCGFTEKRLFLLLPVLRSRCVSYCCCSRCRSRCRGIESPRSDQRLTSRRGTRCPPASGSEKHRRQRGCLSLLEPGEVLGFGRVGVAVVIALCLLGPEDRASQVTGQRRSQLRYFGRNGGWQLRIVRRQLLQPLGAGHAVDVVQLALLRAVTALLRLQRPQHGAEHRAGQPAGEHGQRAWVEAGDRARLCAQFEGFRGHLGR
ncbi:hypothetical protein FQZ97_499990 [compost metagenome]